MTEFFLDDEYGGLCHSCISEVSGDPQMMARGIGGCTSQCELASGRLRYVCSLSLCLVTRTSRKTNLESCSSLMVNWILGW